MSPQKSRHRVWVLLGTVALVLAGGQAWAADSPWYVAARFGQSTADAQFGSRHTKRIDDEAGAGAVDIGYQITPHLAVEAGYQDLGSHAGWGSPCRQTDDNCIERLATLQLCAVGFECTEVLVTLAGKLDGFSLAVVPSWRLGERLSLRGKVGLLAWDADVGTDWVARIAVGGGFGQAERFSGEDLLAGLGLQYSFPSGLGILLQHEELTLDAGTTSLGLSYRF